MNHCIKLLKSLHRTPIVHRNYRSDQLFADPYKRINECFVEPLYQHYFNPSVEKQMQCTELIEKQGRQIKFLGATHEATKLPNSGLSEVLFIGRSNVGKSSLINALLAGKDLNKMTTLARTSRVAGNTKTLNFYKVGDLFSLVDAPGYGVKEPTYYQELLHQYIDHNIMTYFKAAFLLLDPKLGLSNSDQQLIQKLDSMNVCYALVFTKIDQTIAYHIHEKITQIYEKLEPLDLQFIFPGIFLTSATSLEGIGILRTFIMDLVKQQQQSVTN